MSLRINGKLHPVKVDGKMPLLWFLRDELGLTGTKIGCGKGICGTCTVLVDGIAKRSCILPVAAVTGQEITTIEGLGAGHLHPVQKAWLELDVSQCGYCQAGQIVTAVALLKKIPQPTDADIDAAMRVICRCGTYNRIREAIHQAAKHPDTKGA
jgi:isoquinoline 1-oxidoreductase alpha subunit